MFQTRFVEKIKTHLILDHLLLILPFMR